MVLDYLQTMWAQKPVCGLFANNVGSLAAIVGPTSPVFAANVSRQVPLFAGQPADDCGPLHVSMTSVFVMKKSRCFPPILVCSKTRGFKDTTQRVSTCINPRKNPHANTC